MINIKIKILTLQCDVFQFEQEYDYLTTPAQQIEKDLSDKTSGANLHGYSCCRIGKQNHKLKIILSIQIIVPQKFNKS